MPLYSVEPDDPDVLARQIMNLDVMAHFQAGEQTTMNLVPGLAAATCPVLVLAGDLDPVCPIEMSDEIVARSRTQTSPTNEYPTQATTTSASAAPRPSGRSSPPGSPADTDIPTRDETAA